MIETPIWTAPHPLPAAEPQPWPQMTDVAIVGAGYTGLSAALALRRRGVETAVLEARRVGAGASSRNGGMVLPGFKVGPETLLRRYGKQSARVLFDATLKAIDFVEQLVATERIDCGYSRTGHLEVACSVRHLDRLVGTQKLLDRAFEHPTRVVSKTELGEEVSSPLYAGGLLDERSGALDPYRYLLGLAGAVRRAGATVLEEARVHRVRRRGKRWHLMTAGGDLSCERVLIATGAYGGPEFAWLRRRIVPLGSYIIATEELSADLARNLIPQNRMIFDTKRLLHYFRLTPDSRLLFGGRAAFAPANRTTTRRSAEILRRDMIATFPQLRDVKIEYAWGGTLDVTFDLMPHAGTTDGCFFATGYAGHGIALATFLGALTAAAMVEHREPRPFERALPQAPLRLYGGTPWFLPLVGAWQRLADMVS